MAEERETVSVERKLLPEGVVQVKSVVSESQKYSQRKAGNGQPCAVEGWESEGCHIKQILQRLVSLKSPSALFEAVFFWAKLCGID